MRQNRRTAVSNSGPEKAPAEQVVKDIRRATRRQFSAEENIRIVLEAHRVCAGDAGATQPRMAVHDLQQHPTIQRCMCEAVSQRLSLT